MHRSLVRRSHSAQRGHIQARCRRSHLHGKALQDPASGSPMLVHVQGASLKDAAHDDAVELRVLDDELLLAEPLQAQWCRYHEGFLKLDGTSARKVAH